jgi:hypothetical protein
MLEEEGGKFCNLHEYDGDGGPNASDHDSVISEIPEGA